LNPANGDDPDVLTEDETETVVRARFNPRPLSSVEVDELVQGRLAGQEIAFLAERFGIHRNTVMKHRARRGVPGRRFPGRTLSDDELRAAGELYQSGLRLELVGEALGVDRRYLRRELPKLGVAIRAAGQQKRRRT
jgi:hypothetical protein